MDAGTACALLRSCRQNFEASRLASVSQIINRIGIGPQMASSARSRFAI